jgi:hypothetical protein
MNSRFSFPAVCALVLLLASCAVGGRIFREPPGGSRAVVLKEELYINTHESGSGRLCAAHGPYYDPTRQQRVMHIRSGESIFLESFGISQGGLLSGYTTYRCHPLRKPDVVFDLTVGTDGNVFPDFIPW